MNATEFKFYGPHCDQQLKAVEVLHWLQQAVEQHETPESLRSDNGPEFIAKPVQRRLKENRNETIHIEPDSPRQNGFGESFHERFRGECLNREQLWTLTEARAGADDYRQKYNQVRPYRRLGDESPAVFAVRSCPSSAPVRLRPPRRGTDKEQTKK